MNITGFSVIQRDDGREVTISFLIPNNAELEDSDILKAFDVAKEVGGEQTASRDTVVVPDGKLANSSTKVEEPGEQPAASAGSRRRGGGATETTAVPASDPSPQSGGSRRRQGSPTEAAPAATIPSTESGGSRRRGSSSGASAETSTSAPSETSANNATAPVSSGGARRRGSGTATQGGSATTAESQSSKGTITTASPSDAIGDADLSRAVSNAAQKIGNPKPVMELVMKLGFGPNVARIPAEERQGFLDKLEALVKQETE